jgi:hypothetical protein
LSDSPRNVTDATTASKRLPWLGDVCVFLGFTVVSFVYFGSTVWRHPGRQLLGTGQDNEIFAWAFAWWPHALLHGLNPFITHALYAQGGANLAWITSVPILAVAAAPLTLAFGPVASFNVVALLLPAVGGWAAYRLCFALTGSVWASVIGGYLYGFSSFILAQQLLAHLHLTANFVLPLVALTFVRFFRAEVSRRGFAVRFGALLAVQLLISTEVTFTLTLMLVISLALVFVFVRSARVRLRVLLPWLAVGYGLAVVFAAPLVAFALFGGLPGNGFAYDPTGTDLTNLIVPPPLNATAGDIFPSVEIHFDAHDDALFVGIPALIIVALYVWRERRSGWGYALLLFFGVSVMFALGPELHVKGKALFALPWTLVEHAPVFENVSKPRFGEYVGLVTAVIVALWTASTRGRIFRRPYVLASIAVVALVPAFWHHPPTYSPPQPAFFTTGLYKSCLTGETVALFPHDGDANILQAESGFRFRVAGGYLTPLVFGKKSVVGFNNDPTVVELNYFSDRGQPTAESLRAFAVRHRVDRFVTLSNQSYPSRALLRTLGPVEEVGGVFVAPACGQSSLRTRPVPPSAQRMLNLQREDAQIAYCQAGEVIGLPAGLRPAALLANATRAVFVHGEGLRCSPPPGYVRHGLAPERPGIPGDTYVYYVPRAT